MIIAIILSSWVIISTLLCLALAAVAARHIPHPAHSTKAVGFADMVPVRVTVPTPLPYPA